jgi:hypothetical protein
MRTLERLPIHQQVIARVRPATRCHTILERGEDDCESVDTSDLIAMIHNDAAGEEEER